MTKTLTQSDSGDVVQHYYGRIRPGIYHYITPAMVISVTLMCTLIALGFEKIRTYFMHGPVLNGLMLVVITTGITMAFRNNFSIYQVARLLKRVERIRQNGRSTSEEIHELRTAVEHKAHLLSMATFSAALEKLSGTGSFSISDPDARLIKSKFGARISHMRGKVNYFCGILVMLGLIGTFWGLLGTITSVGQAMTTISSNFAAQSAAGAGQPQVDMGGFLQSISKPLEGMGVGFSASLFGLTGSLFLGFFNFLCGHAQNRFIEDFSRWIDDCIPTISPAFTDRMKEAKVPGSDEMKAWLAGFIYLSNKTNQQIGTLVEALAAAQQTATSNLQQTEKLYSNQNQILKAIEAGNRRLKGVHLSLHNLSAEIKTTSLVFKRLPEGMSQLADLIAGAVRTQQKTTAAHLEHIGELFSRMEAHTASLSTAAETQTLLLKESQTSHNHPAITPAGPDVAELTASVTALLSEMSHKNEEALLGTFLRAGGQNPESIDSLFKNPN